MIETGLAILSLIIILALAIVAFFVLIFVFWIFMIVDCAQRKFKDENEKIVWILIIIFLSWLGAIIYYFVVKRANLTGITKK